MNIDDKIKNMKSKQIERRMKNYHLARKLGLSSFAASIAASWSEKRIREFAAEELSIDSSKGDQDVEGKN